MRFGLVDIYYNSDVARGVEIGHFDGLSYDYSFLCVTHETNGWNFDFLYVKALIHYMKYGFI